MIVKNMALVEPHKAESSVGAKRAEYSDLHGHLAAFFKSQARGSGGFDSGVLAERRILSSN